MIVENSQRMDSSFVSKRMMQPWDAGTGFRFHGTNAQLVWGLDWHFFQPGVIETGPSLGKNQVAGQTK